MKGKGVDGSYQLRQQGDDALEKFRLALNRLSRQFKNRPSYISEEDLVQEMLCHLCEKRAQGGLKDKPDSYILRGCWFYGKNHLRKVRNRISTVSLDEPIDDQGTLLKEVIPQDCPLACPRSEKLTILCQAIEKVLNDREKEVIKYSLQDFTIREIGEIMGISHVMVVKLQRGICLKCQELESFS